MIELKDFSKAYSKKSAPVVFNINLRAEKGITGLLGLNGAGKTTVIKAITAEHYATSGSVKISDGNGENARWINASENPAAVRAVIGCVPESGSLPLNLTVAEYLHFAQELYSPESSSRKKDFMRAVEEWELGSVLEKKIGELSKGFRQRVSFAQCFIHNPPNVILDEPVNGLDPAQIIQFRNIIKEHGKSKTILISTHLMQEVHSLCDYVYILSGGTTAACGTEEEILRQTGEADIEKAFLSVTKTGSQKNE